MRRAGLDGVGSSARGVEEGGGVRKTAVAGCSHGAGRSRSQGVITPECNKMMYRIGIFAAKDIRPFTELTYDYHYEDTHKRDLWGGCKCGAAKCVAKVWQAPA